VPGKLIKLFDTQADWQSGTLENLDATSTPGVIIPTGDYTRTYDSKAEWDQGSKANVVSDAEGRIMLDRPLRGNAWVGGTGQYEYDEVFMGQRISPRGLLAEVRMYVGGSSGSGRYMYVTDLSGNILWLQSMSSHGQWVGYPNLLVSEDVIVWVNASDWLSNVGRAATDDYPPGVTENGRIGGSLTAQPNYPYPLQVQYRCEYAESGTWTSPWLAHGISSPQSGMVSLRADIPAGTSVTPHVRYSSDGGTTYTQWYDLDDRRMTDVQGTHVQLRLTLATDDPRQTPTVDKAILLIGKLHRWTSPVIDLTGVGADATLMLATSQTELDVVREVREGPNFTFTRNSTAYNPETGVEVAVNEPRYVEGPFPGSKALLVEEGTQNLVAPEYQKFVTWAAHAGASVTLTQDQVVPEWGASDATRIQTSGGSSTTKYYRGLVSPSVSGQAYTIAVWVKNIGSKNVIVTNNLGVTVTVSPGEQKRVIISGVGNGSSTLQIQFSASDPSDALDFMAWRPMAVAKPYITSFHPGTRSADLATIPAAGVLSTEEGTWEWYIFVDANVKRQVAGQFPAILHISSSGGGRAFAIYHRDASDQFTIVTSDGSASRAGNFADSLIPDGWRRIAVTWSQAKVNVFCDGAKIFTLENPTFPAAFGDAHIGYHPLTGTYTNTKFADLRISSRARTDEEILAAYQSGQPLPVDEWTTYKMTGGPGPWEKVGTVFPCSARRSLQTRLTLTKTDSVAQSLDKCGVWDAIVLKMMDRPQLTLSPPQVTHVTAYVENSEPLIEYTASLPGVPEAKKVHIRVPVPEGSSLAYCQEVAERVLIGKSKERLALVCQVPLITRLRFSELVPVSIPYIGYTRERPYLARVQKMAHDVLAGNPHTKLWLGDFLPDDAEALVRLLLKEG
jgi:hypothetical protein